MKLAVYTIQETLFEGEAKSITLNTSTGAITILDNHIPLISIVLPGEISYINYQNEHGQLVISAGGIIEVRPNREVIVLANPS